MLVEAKRGVDFARKYAPGASLWWAELAFSRQVADHVEKRLDPDGQEAFQRSTDRLRDQTGQDLWGAQTEAADADSRSRAALRHQADQVH